MGEVWKARDTKLRRDVAIKTVTPALEANPQWLRRLEREAELLASLNHHHIATVLGLEQVGSESFLVLELVDGDTLAHRLVRGAIPVEEALTLALQLAQALEAAHAKDIVHRDLKPANIKITRDRRIKVLDFGIAKALTAAQGDDTQTLDPTRPGVAIGTPAYMSPEQARGEPVGVQSDIWSFGTVLYEMLTGVSPFKRKTGADTIASIVQSSPDLAALPADLPATARHLVLRCLEKDPTRRPQHMETVRILIEEALAAVGAPASDAPRSRPKRSAAWVAGGVVAAAIAGGAIWLWGHRSSAPPPAHPIVAMLSFPGRPLPYGYAIRTLAFSPDGSSVAYASRDGVQIRRIDQQHVIDIPTEPASNPFFSPDGEWIGVFLETAIAKVPARGGKPVVLSRATDRPAGGDWRADGTILFATSEALYQMSDDGGNRRVIVKPARDRGELLYAWPQFLPGGELVLFTVVGNDPKAPLNTVLLNLNTLDRKTLLQGSSARYVRSGHLVFVTGSMLNLVTFDAEKGQLTGKPIAIPSVDLDVALDTGAANFAISDTGSLVFTAALKQPQRTLEWIDRRGQRVPIAVEPQDYGYVKVAPDGTRVAVERTTAGNRDIWILDLKRLTQTQLTDGPTEDMLPVWSADGRRVFFASRRSGNFDVYSQSADGASGAKLEFAGPEIQAPTSVTPDGTRLLIYDQFKDLALLDFAKPDRLTPLLHSDFDERLGEISPDGHWIAYESNESGNQYQIVLRSFPNVNDRREMISVNGGRFPKWAPQGEELYYVTPDGAMMAVSITLAPSLAIGATNKLFDWQKPPASRSGRMYDVAPDGRFLVVKPTAPNPAGPTNVSIIVNWLGSVHP